MKSEKYEIVKAYERGPLRFTVKVTKKEITIAERITLELEAALDQDYEMEFPQFGEKLRQFGIVDYTSLPPRLGEGKKVVTQKFYVLEPFLSGEYTIPPITLSFWKIRDEERHKLETEGIIIKVTSLLPKDMKKLYIKDISGPVEIPGYKQVYIWITGIGLLVAISGGGLAYLIYKKRTLQERSTRIPPQEIAYRELEVLLAEKLIEKGRVKLFYMRITDILRHYIENRFGLRAPEQTTEEFLAELSRSNLLETSYKNLLKEFLNHCDLVKFAEYSPTNDEIQTSFDSCKEFIMTTKAGKQGNSPQAVSTDQKEHEKYAV